MAKTRIETFPDIIPMVAFFHKVPEYDVSLYSHKKMKTDPELSFKVLNEVLPVLEEQDDYTNDALFARLSDFAKEHEYKTGQVMWPIRTALSGEAFTPGGATQLLWILGKEEGIRRINAAINKLESEK